MTLINLTVPGLYGEINLQDLLNSIYGSYKRHPYYIVAPRWVETSAGIKVLHYLCHSLNASGYNAYLVLTEGIHDGKPRVNGNLMTPILTQEIVDSHLLIGLNPITVITETMPKNPIKGTNTVRIIANHVGLLGGPSKYGENEMVFAYSKTLAKHYSQHFNEKEPPLIFLPAIDPREIKRSKKKKNHILVYAAKYRMFNGAPPKLSGMKTKEIFRDGPRAQSRKKVLEMISEARAVVSYENSSILTEAVLSGTPAFYIPSDFLPEEIASIELKNIGSNWGFDPNLISKLQKQTKNASEVYLDAIKKFKKYQIAKFIEITQNHANLNSKPQQIQLPQNKNLFAANHRLGLAIQIYKTHGFVHLARVVWNFVKRRIFN